MYVYHKPHLGTSKLLTLLSGCALYSESKNMEVCILCMHLPHSNAIRAFMNGQLFVSVILLKVIEFVEQNGNSYTKGQQEASSEDVRSMGTRYSRALNYVHEHIIILKYKRGSPTCIKSTGDKIGIPDGWVIYHTVGFPLRRHTSTSPILSQRYSSIRAAPKTSRTGQLLTK